MKTKLPLFTFSQLEKKVNAYPKVGEWHGNRMDARTSIKNPPDKRPREKKNFSMFRICMYDPVHH
jgi:hypothetical protein